MPEMVTCPMCQRSVPADVVHTCPGGPVHVGHWTVTTPDTKETFPRGPSNEQTLLAELWQVKAERDKLQAFKDWCHSYLDTHGVPHHPPGPHGAEGCRIGDRMDWLMAKLANAEQAADHIAAEDRAERDALAVTAERQAEQIKRLRESLEWAFGEVIRDGKSPCLDGGKVAAVCAILKETAPPA